MHYCRPDLHRVILLRPLLLATFKANFATSCLHLCIGVGVFMLLMLLSACGRQSAGISYEERAALEKQVEGASSIDSIETLLRHFEEKGDKIGSIVALRIKGKRLRDESRFEEAVRAHSEAL